MTDHDKIEELELEIKFLRREVDELRDQLGMWEASMDGYHEICKALSIYHEREDK